MSFGGAVLIERRQYVRLKVDTTMEYYIDYVEKKKTVPVRDVSGGGLRFLTKEELAPGRTLSVIFALPETSDTIQAVAEIVWARPAKGMTGIYEAGVNFVEIDPFDREKIGDYVHNQAKSLRELAVQ